jgi:hypothetical protein
VVSSLRRGFDTSCRAATAQSEPEAPSGQQHYLEHSPELVEGVDGHKGMHNTVVKPLLHVEEADVPNAYSGTATPLETTVFDFVSTIAVDTLLLTVSVGFFAFGLTVCHYDQTATADHAEAKAILVALSKFGPTVFPILFAAVLGRAAHVILLWRLERGDRVGTLDLLAGSTSLTSTVNSQLQLRAISIIGLSLILIWALSPIGGQASIRVLSFSDGIRKESVAMSYVVPTSTGYGYVGDTFLGGLGVANSIFLAALYSPVATKNSTMDLWGNVKIPLVEVYENSSPSDPEGWFNVTSEKTIFASLMGTPVAGYVQASNVVYSFNMQTSYLHLDCPFANSSYSTYAGPADGSSFFGLGATIYLNYNASCGTSNLTCQGSGPLAGMRPGCTSPPNIYSSDSKYNVSEGIFPPLNLDNRTPRNFTYYDQQLGTSSFCYIETTYVEVVVTCGPGFACGAVRVRRSTRSHPHPAYTVLDDVGGPGTPVPGGDWGLLLGGLLTVAPPFQSGLQTVLQRYLANPDDATDPGTSNVASPPIDRTLWAIRQGQIMNSYHDSLSDIYNLTRGRVADPQAFGNATTGMITTSFEVFVCHRGWVVALSVASSILIISCLAHLVVRLLLNRTPELMLNISSLATRDNPYIDTGGGGTALGASERARLFKDKKVRFGDVRPEHDIGQLAIASLGTAKTHHVEKVRKKRLYR